MTSTVSLSPEQLSWRCPLELFEFQTTDELDDLEDVVGQARALESIEFGIGMRHDGYNLFVLGPPGVGKRTIVHQLLATQAGGASTPMDCCYVQDFSNFDKPSLLQVPAGRGVQLQREMELLLEELQTSIQAAIDAEEHQNRLEQVQQEVRQEQEELFAALSEKADRQGIQAVRTPGGFALAPMVDGEVLSPEEFSQLPEEERERIEQAVASLQEELRALVEQAPHHRKQAREKIKQLNRETSGLVITLLFNEIKEKYKDLPQVTLYLDGVESDVTENADDFQANEEPTSLFDVEMPDRSFQKYQVNVLVDNSQVVGAPVVYEEHPNYQNLLGRVEHLTHMGTLVTDFTLIRAGALHRANGGYLLLDARRLLQQPYAWDSLKRALFSRHIKIESLAESLSLVSTVSIEPEPIPLDVKVVLLGDRLLYYLLYEHDPDFAELFKVSADFEDELDRTPESCRLFARLIATLARRDQLRPLDVGAVARVIEHAVRMSDSSSKLTAQIRAVADLLREADYWGSQARAAVLTAAHVSTAIEKRLDRTGRMKERLQEQIQRDVLLVDTTGEKVAQVNGLSVYELGGYHFGKPTRITATTRLGRGEVVDIEREVELGGAIHSKGVLILGSLLAEKFAKDQPLSLNASLVFEQSYGLVEGDSASVAELCALLSSLANVPVRQSLAVTGSINQHGQVQPIGGVNEKIEGFFDVCQARGLSGDQGVVIPASNVQHLMLRHDVAEAAMSGKFHIYATSTIDQVIELLTGVPAGIRDPQGEYPPESLNGRVAARLKSLFEMQRKYHQATGSGGSHE